MGDGVAQQLRDRLDTVFSDAPWRDVRAAGGSAGVRIADVRTMVVHETSGWPPRNNGRDMFFRAFIPAAPPAPPRRLTTQLYVSGILSVTERRTGRTGLIFSNKGRRLGQNILNVTIARLGYPCVGHGIRARGRIDPPS